MRLKSEGCFCSRQVQKVCFFESSSPVVRKGGARETWHQLSLRTEPRTVKYNVVKCPMRQRVNLKTRHPRVWEIFLLLRPQSGSEHELTDPLASLCCLAPVFEVHICAETKHVLLSVLGRRSGVVFLFAPTAPGVLQGSAGRFSPCFFSVGSLARFVTRTTLSVHSKAHTSANAAVVLLSRNGLESIPCSWKSLFTEGERSFREVPEGLGAQLWYRSVESADRQTVVEKESHARQAPPVSSFRCLCQVESLFCAQSCTDRAWLK